jgi:tetratricopeptide (TPR) repeat protein
MLQQADSAYAAAAKIDPANGYLLVSRSDYFNRIGNIAASNELLQTAVVSEALDVDTKIKLLTEYLKTVLQKKDSAALAETDNLFARVLAQHPQAGEFHALYAELLVTTGRIEDAREQQGYAVALSPNDKNLWLQLIGINMQLNDYPAVVTTAEKALTYLPDVPEFYLYRGVGYALQDDNQKALDAYLAGIKAIDPKNVSILSDLWGQAGDIYHQMGENDKAYAAYDEALRLNDKNVGVLNNYSYFLSVENRDLSKAERMAGQVVKLEPNNPTYLDTYAWIYFRQGNYMLAKFYMESALSKSDEPNSDLLEHYGDILFMDGYEEQALEQWQKALEVAKGETPERDVTVLKKKIETKKYIEE